MIIIKIILALVIQSLIANVLFNIYPEWSRYRNLERISKYINIITLILSTILLAIILLNDEYYILKSNLFGCE